MMPPEQEARSTLPRCYSLSRSAVNPRVSIVSNPLDPPLWSIVLSLSLSLSLSRARARSLSTATGTKS